MCRFQLECLATGTHKVAKVLPLTLPRIEPFPEALGDYPRSAFPRHLIAYEAAARDGLVIDEQILVEIVDPTSGLPVPEGDIGEVVVTTFNPDYPLVRFGTGT